MGCVLTFPLPRLEGVPQIKGRPNVSYHAHMGPIKFLTPIHCGSSPMPIPVASLPTSPANSVANPSLRGSVIDSLDDRGSVHSSLDAGVTFQLEGVTESCSEDAGFMLSETSTEDGNLEDRFTASDELGLVTRRFRAYEPVNRNKWLSTPDLRSVQDSIYSTEEENDVSFLYRNLLSGTDHEELDNELLEPRLPHKKRRPFSAMPFANKEEMRNYKKAMMRRGSKYSTLPIVMEDPPGSEGDKKRLSVQVASPLDLLNESLDNSFQEEQPQTAAQNDVASLHSVSLDSSVEASGVVDAPPEGLLQSEGSVAPVSPESPSYPGHGLLDSGTPTPSIYRHPLFPQHSSPGDGAGSREDPAAPAPAPLSPQPTTPAAAPLSPEPGSSPTADRPGSLKLGSPTIPLGSPPATTASAKSMIIASGGDGHINWSEKKPGDSRYEDICLLLWQYRL